MAKKKRTLSLALAFSLSASMLGSMPAQAAKDGNTAPVNKDTPIYKDTSYSFAERAADLISRMNLSEKASQMNSSKAPAIPHLGIASYGWWNEALHGVSSMQLNSSGNASVVTNATSYPIDLSLASSWDPGLMYGEASMISDEAREVVPDNRLNLNFYSPTINLSRDPRWGRNDESYGEDPFLTTKIASQFVNGMEGKDMNGNLLTEGKGYLKTATTLKHYTANNSEADRRTGSADMDNRTLREFYTAPFKGVIENTHVNSLMTSYNSVNGVPTSASVYLLDNLVRQTWGFNGYITSDCDAVREITNGHQWTPPGWSSPINEVQRMAFANSAGVDLDCNAGYSDAYNYGNTIPTAISQKITTETGLYTENDVDTSLLRMFTGRMQLGEFDNPDNVPWITEARQRYSGTWTSSDSNNAVTETPERLEMAHKVADSTMVLLKNNETTKKDGTKGKLLPVQVPKSGAFNVAVIGYCASSMYLGGYSSMQTNSAAKNLVSAYDGIKNAVQKINPDASVTYYKGFTDSGNNVSDLKTVDPAAIEAAKAADLVVVYTGTDRGTASEDKDREDIVLPGAQASLIQQAGQANQNTIAVMETVGTVDVTAFEPNVSAMLWSSFNGERKGEALADVLLGVYNPSGRLPFTWYKNDSQLANMTDYTIRPTENTPGRTYMYFKGSASYPFGYGLSYTNFAYKNLKIDKKNLDANDSFKISVDVTNTGAVKGDDVVELYINTPDASAALQRPIKRLSGFQKVTLDANETKTVTLTVNVPDLAFFNEDQNKYVIDDGRYGIQISDSSADSDIKLQDSVKVSGALKPALNVVTVKANQEGDSAMDIPNRIIYNRKQVVVPHITVSMSDESLYGYIEKGQSKQLPQGMTVTYSSNRPSIAYVDGKERIHTGNKDGVATITAAVNYQGVTKTCDFIIYVKAQGYIDGINVDGKALDGFAEDNFVYSICIPDGVNTIPQISAVNSDPRVNVKVAQAASIPGAATIVTKEGDFSQTYKIGFGRAPVSADFKTGTLGKQWSIMNEDSSKYKFVDSGLQITAQAGKLADGSAKNVFYQQASGNWTADTSVNVSAAPGDGQQAGMLVMEDNNNYLRTSFTQRTMTFGTWVIRYTSVDLYKCESGVETQAGSAMVWGQTPVSMYFRLVKNGSGYTAYYSTDGTSYTSIGSTTANFANPKLGIMAVDSTTNPITAVFPALNVTISDSQS